MIKKNKCYWITGLPSAGKTTIAKKLFHFLKIKNRKVVLLDAEHLRKVFGFDKYDNKSININSTYWPDIFSLLSTSRF